MKEPKELNFFWEYKGVRGEDRVLFKGAKAVNTLLPDLEEI